MAKPARILVVDDEADLVETIRFRLEQEGHQVLTAVDGLQGLATARSEQPDLIVLDVMMPRLGGQDVLRALRRSSATAGTPVIMATALGGDDATGEILVEADAYIRKPYDLAVLIDEIDRIDRGRPALPT